MKLTKQQKEQIKETVENSMEYFDEVLNDRLVEILAEVDPKLTDEDSETLAYARQMYFWSDFSITKTRVFI